MDTTRYASFREFYPYYLSEHADVRCRRMHYVGSTLALASVALSLATRNAWWLLGALFAGYACAWIGHFVFEKNRPATFSYPFYSFAGDWVMFADMLRGRIRF
ncbi:MAG TPA: DUF962 domain-containing protein [Candidatus Saccharimonadia bacterium]|nr:DUF962 domain-containing protein [Candidatus Saccharimonadia bacterium]